MTSNNILGASLTNNKVRFAVFSEHASNIELCLFSSDEKTETKIPLTKDDDNIWSTELDHIQAGQKYGFRAHGEYNPKKGLYFNPNKLLIDPFAKELSKTIDNWESKALLAENNIDSSSIIPKSVVVLDNIEDDKKAYPFLHQKPNKEWKDTIIYEAHVKGFTINHPDLPDDIKGKFAAFSRPEIIDYIKDLGITHLELLPVTATCGGLQLEKEKGLSDYWGYNPINHFALDPRYGTRAEFKQMVNDLHKAGIEVGLDLVYNHTGEFGDNSNLISYKGLDSPNYYRMTDNKEFINSTGCGNSINTNKTSAKVIEDSLKYFSQNLGVDGFRFDLAGDCALDENQQFNDNNKFMEIVRKISEEEKVKVSGEPWSALGGYYRGQMNGLMEWNDKHKETLRGFYRGDRGKVPSLAGHVSGGEGLYFGQTQSKYIRYVAVHDGFTAFDVANYNEKNNWANNENNNDGCNNNCSSQSPNQEIAFRRVKSMMAANILSRGIPLINAGDEVGRTKQGNNNTYCQDNELSWHNWKNLSPEQKDLYKFIRKVNVLRQSHPVLSNLDIFSGETVDTNNRKDIEWIRPNGQEMQGDDWNCDYAQTLAYIINGEGGKVSPNEKSKNNSDDDFLVIMSGNDYHEVEFKLPPPPNKGAWQVVLDTANNDSTNDEDVKKDINTYTIKPFGYVVLTSKKPDITKELLMQMQIKKLKDLKTK